MSGTDPRTGREPDDPRNSNDDLAGDMGVSSEREGPTGSSRRATDGVKDTSLSTEHGETDPDRPRRPPRRGAPARGPDSQGRLLVQGPPQQGLTRGPSYWNVQKARAHPAAPRRYAVRQVGHCCCVRPSTTALRTDSTRSG